jgi:dihydroxyacid dehydratase/phosphogluconate dehydratase
MAVRHHWSVRWNHHVGSLRNRYTTKLTRRRGGEGMRFSLQTREIIADSIETITCAQFHDANISIPGCDKNMPGVVVSAASIGRNC